jgi:hypothetical protein
LPLSGEQLGRLGSALYDMLRNAPHFQLAMVGWDVERFLELDELIAEWEQHMDNGYLAGLVVARELLPRLPASSYFEPFDDAHVWIPYAGSIPMVL